MDKNSELTEIFNDWLKNPRESLEWEMKNWIDPTETAGKAIIAKSLIALENHGGGYLIIGFDDKTSKPDESRRIKNIDCYSVDVINSIIARFAEPKFHVDTSIQVDKTTGKQYPFIRVYGLSSVPVRACSQDESKNIIADKYYIRRAGPKSDMPQDGIEWDKLIRRCVLNQREEMIKIIKGFNLIEATNVAKDTQLDLFINKSLEKWRIQNSALPNSSDTKNKYGYYYFSCQFLGNKKEGIKKLELKNKLVTLRKYTGWPLFLTLDQEIKLIDDVFELSLIPRGLESDHSDFWRASIEGFTFILRGYQSDCRSDYTPGEVFDFGIPVWRLGEYLLHVLDIGNFLYEEGFQVVINCEWNGLKNRKLVSLDGRRHVFGKYESNDDVYNTTATFSDKEIQDLLPSVTQKILEGLYEKFNLFTPESEFYEIEISKMRRGI